MSQIIYHVVTSKYWAKLSKKTAYTAPTFAEERFIHCCTEAQINYVLTTYFKNAGQVLLLKIDTSLLLAELKFEAANGQVFPHIYGAINKNAITEIESIQL